MKGRTIQYSEVELAFLHAHAALPRRDLHARFVERFDRADVTRDQIKAKCTRMGLKTGRTGCYRTGNVPANKGRRGQSAPGSKATQFKSGQMPHNTKPLGYERICKKDGYILIKVAQRDPHTGAATRMVRKHRHVWAQANGPIPKGHVVRFLNGDKTDCDIENLICVPTSLNARLNVMGFNDLPPELRGTALAQARLADRIGELAPSPMQTHRRKPGFRPPSAATPPADSLRPLIVEKIFYYDVRAIAASLDLAIAQVVEARGWACDISELVPPGAEPAIIHIDRSRLKHRPDLRNRLRDVLAAQTSKTTDNCLGKVQ